MNTMCSDFPQPMAWHSKWVWQAASSRPRLLQEDEFLQVDADARAGLLDERAEMLEHLRGALLARALEGLDRERDVVHGRSLQRLAEIVRRGGPLRLAFRRCALQALARDLVQIIDRLGLVGPERGDAEAGADADCLGAERDARAVEPLA